VHDYQGGGCGSPGRWRVPMLFVAGNKTPRESGNQKFEKDGVAASGIR